MRTVTAKPALGGSVVVLAVHSYLWGFIRIGRWTPDSILVRWPGEPSGLVYRTVTDFLADWVIAEVDTRQFRCPFIKQSVGLGDAVAEVAECAPLFLKRLFKGCLDRRAWLNLWATIVPW